jgi:DNA repair exonuclease SbcCD ATPase subunit
MKARFEQIIVITHVESIHDAIDNCIWVDYDETAKISRVRTQQANDYAVLEGVSVL